MASRTNLITILGPTACGKTALATRLAARIGGQIISADSRQVYRGMDIGTGKDIDEYTVDGRDIPYHLVDIVDAGYKYNLYEYLRDFGSALERVIAEGDRPILCGGTGLYIEAVLSRCKANRWKSFGVFCRATNRYTTPPIRRLSTGLYEP